MQSSDSNPGIGKTERALHQPGPTVKHPVDEYVDMAAHNLRKHVPASLFDNLRNFLKSDIKWRQTKFEGKDLVRIWEADGQGWNATLMAFSIEHQGFPKGALGYNAMFRHNLTMLMSDSPEQHAIAIWLYENKLPEELKKH